MLVQLGIAQQQLANWDGSIAAFTAAKSLTPNDDEIDAYLVQAHITARRFDRAEAIAREKQRSLANVPDGEREHAVQPPYAVRAPFQVTVEQHFRVRAGPELVPARRELVTELGEVVDLPAEGQHDVVVARRAHGLRRPPGR